nr:hypothetical protein CFP56_65981 [Quercus suber]
MIHFSSGKNSLLHASLPGGTLSGSSCVGGFDIPLTFTASLNFLLHWIHFSFYHESNQCMLNIITLF